MTPYLLVSRSAEYETRIRALLGERLTVVPGEFLTFGPEAVVSRAPDQPRVALLGPLLNYEETKALVDALTTKHPDLGVIVVREQRSDLEDWVDELTLHAVLSPNATDDTTMALLDRLADWLVANNKADAQDFEVPRVAEADESSAHDELLALVEPEKSVDHGDVEVQQDPEPEPEPEPEPQWEFPPLESGQPTEAIAVVAPKGGQGKTTVSVNLAAGLAKIAPNSVVLVDGDLQFGDITAALDLKPEGTIAEATADAAADELILKTTLTHHEGGFFVVASAASPELGDTIRPEAIARLIEQLRGIFRFVVIDTTPGLGEHSLVILEHVTDAIFVSNLGVPALRGLRTELEVLRTLGLLPANRRIVVNQTEKNVGLTLKDAEQIIGAPVDIDIPRSAAVMLASNKGVPLIYDDPRDPAARALRSLVSRIAPETANARAQRRWRFA